MITIQKENIKDLNFITDFNIIESTSIHNDLKKAQVLGNNYKIKSKISFKTSQGDFLVETTVWSKTENFITLKGGVCIPVSSIFDVKFF